MLFSFSENGVNTYAIRKAEYREEFLIHIHDNVNFFLSQYKPIYLSSKENTTVFSWKINLTILYYKV